MDNTIVLFEDKKNCCSCGACMNVCPKQAIEMKIDEFGYSYPFINEEKCIQCGACKRVCAFQNGVEVKATVEAYAAATKNQDTLMNTASGGIFSQIAKNVLSNGGCVCGVALERSDDTLIPKHTMIYSVEDLEKLQGSKYAQSVTGDIFQHVKKELENGKQVLFSGTPCQVAGLRAYLKKDYDNLLLVDIICHGAPSTKMFQDYISNQQKKLKGKIIDYKFRDKKYGQGYVSKITYQLKDGKVKVKWIPGKLTSFVGLFLQKEVFRESCYACKYANLQRISDITIGDYWGVYQEHAKELKDSEMSNEKGISCILVNSEKGQKTIETMKTDFDLISSTKEKIALHNEQLNHSCEHTDKRNAILELYRKNGYGALEDYYKKSLGYKKYVYWMGAIIPKKLKSRIKVLLKK